MRVLPASWSSSSASTSSAKEPSSNHTTGASSSSSGVYLNIYDISPLNHYLYWVGLGIFHSGIEVHGMEYGFGAHEYPTSGVFEVEPKSCPGFIFRRSVCVGSTDMSRSQVRTAIEDLAEDYHGDTYHLIIKNCNHFTADVCKRLTGKPVPGWVNRLARLDDGLGSNASIIDGSDEDDLDHLLTTPNSDVIPSRDRTLTPARDSF
ncbi:hypothetical protein EJB05_08355 [Eragrostis curvula]|uniref:PPPDE domain-containing protein n=1 Tax=Eragrostis curvula TaxID=38414 RepID=A0A5J9WMU8_9POAL|nr:hypothetical protein EJB05_08355 [Eragrostis curvula]